MQTTLKETLDRFFPFLTWIGELKHPVVLRADILAGITVAMVLIPQSMANAQLAELPPYYGFYAAFVPLIASALFGSSRQLSTGPVALVSLMTAAALQPIVDASHPDYITYAILLAFLVGIFQLVLGLLRLGILVNFLSQPVVLGFTNAAALIIATSQLDKLFGVYAARGGAHYERMWRLVQAASEGLHWPTLILGIATIVFLAVLRYLNPRIPAVLLAALVSTLLSRVIHFEGVYGGEVVGVIPAGMPAFAPPGMDWAILQKLLMAAATISLIGFTETISIAKAVATQTRQRIRANQELVAQGLSNLLGSFFLSHPVSGSFVRTAVNFRAGAATGFSSVVTGLMVVVVLLFFTPLLYHMPLATLAAIIIVSVSGLIHIAPIRRAWKVHRHDGIVAVVTFALTLLFAPHLDVGIAFGAGLSLVLYLYRTMKPRVAALSRHPDGALRDARVHDLEMCEVMAMLRFDGSLYFGSTGAFEDMMLEQVAKNPKLRYVIVDAEGINHIDATGEEMLLGVVLRLREAKVEVFFARAKKQIVDALERPGSLAVIGRERFFPVPEQAINAVWQRVEGENWCTRSCPGECPLYRAKPKGAMFYRV